MEFDKDNSGMEKNEESAINEFNEYGGTDSEVAADNETDGQTDSVLQFEDADSQEETAPADEDIDEKAAIAMLNEAGTPNDVNEEKPKNKKLLAVILAVLVIAAASFAAYSVYANNPVRVLATAKKATAADYDKVAANALFSQQKKYIEMTPATEAEFSVDIKSVSSKQGLPLFVLNGSKLNGSFNIDENEKKLDAELGVTLKDEKILNMSVNLDNTLLSLGIPELIDSDYISVDLSTINDDLMKSSLGYMTLPLYDYAGAVEQIFSMSEMTNELNASANEAGIESYKSIVQSVTESVADADKNIEVTKGEPADIEGVNCNSYAVSYSQDFVKDILLEQANALAESYEINLDRNLKVMGKMMPGLYEEYKSQITNPFDEFTANLTNVIFVEPVDAVYYVDKAKKIRRATYHTTVSYDDEQTEITFAINRTGSNNVYDALGMELMITSDANSLNLLLNSEGAHSDKAVFNDTSTLRIMSSGDGVENMVTLDSILNYDAALNEIGIEVGVTSADMPGKMVFAAKGRNNTDEAAKTSETVLDEVRIETPAVDIVLGADYRIGPASSKPRASGDLSRIELLKIDDAALMELYSRFGENYNTLQQKVISLLGI